MLGCEDERDFGEIIEKPRQSSKMGRGKAFFTSNQTRFCANYLLTRRPARFSHMHIDANQDGALEHIQRPHCARDRQVEKPRPRTDRYALNLPTLFGGGEGGKGESVSPQVFLQTQAGGTGDEHKS